MVIKKLVIQPSPPSAWIAQPNQEKSPTWMVAARLSHSQNPTFVYNCAVSEHAGFRQEVKFLPRPETRKLFSGMPVDLTQTKEHCLVHGISIYYLDTNAFNKETNNLVKGILEWDSRTILAFGGAMNLFVAVRTLSDELDINAFTMDFQILVLLASKGRAGIEEIRRNVRGSPAAVSYKVKALLELGHIVRRPSGADGRVSFYELSEPTKELFKNVDDGAALQSAAGIAAESLARTPDYRSSL